MAKKNRQLKKFRSISEFEKEYFPKFYERKVAENTVDAKALGASLAKDSLKKIRKLLAK